MKTGKKALLLALCAVLLVAATVMGTMAYLTYTTEAVVNTFTIGKVELDLDEANVDTKGVMVDETRVKANTYKLMPGHEYTKDPTVTVKAGSEDSYVRMKVEVKNIASLKAAITDSSFYSDNVFLLEKLVTGWDSTKWQPAGYTETADGSGIYEFRYATKVDATETNEKLEPLFETIKVPGMVDKDALAKLSDVQINVTAEAIQADSFADAAAAWKAFA